MNAHIASLIVRARPELAAAVAARLAGDADTEVHAVEAGKIIVVVESPSAHALADRMDEMRGLENVLMVSLVYHQIDDGQIDDGPMDDGQQAETKTEFS
jgi:nitrate reductase NapD